MASLSTYLEKKINSLQILLAGNLVHDQCGTALLHPSELVSVIAKTWGTRSPVLQYTVHCLNQAYNHPCIATYEEPTLACYKNY